MGMYPLPSIEIFIIIVTLALGSLTQTVSLCEEGKHRQTLSLDREEAAADYACSSQS